VQLLLYDCSVSSKLVCSAPQRGQLQLKGMQVADQVQHRVWWWQETVLICHSSFSHMLLRHPLLAWAGQGLQQQQTVARQQLMEQERRWLALSSAADATELILLQPPHQVLADRRPVPASIANRLGRARS
jgi:hypothetical protein